MKPTQRNWVEERLRDTKRVTRNEALGRFISRLAAIIADMKRDGWDIEGDNLKSLTGTDYVYRLISEPV